VSGVYDLLSNQLKTFRVLKWMKKMTTEQIAITDDELEQQLPKPVGYKLLIALPQVEETFSEAGIIKADKTVFEEKLMTVVGLVLDMGAQAYADAERYPTGPWCKAGDYVLFRANSGTRFKVDGVEYRLMNDDSIDAIVADPRGVTRA
jgi:co-chaperonin GroES (HSP10)